MDSKKVYLIKGNASAELACKIGAFWGDFQQLVVQRKDRKTGDDNSILYNISPYGTVFVEPEITRFKDGEVSVKIGENVRGQDVFIIQSFYSTTSHSVNDHLMELLLIVDACKRASAGSITAVVPYFGYARQDRKLERAPISAKLVADLLTVAGVSRVLTMDLHAGQMQGFFNVPVDNLYGAVVASRFFANTLSEEQIRNLVVVSPDVGGAQRARVFRDTLEADLKRRFQETPLTLDDSDDNETHSVGLAIIDKVRAKANESEVMNVIGDVQGRTVIMVDDLIDTAGTMCKGADALHSKGAAEIFAYCTHPVMSDKEDKGLGYTVVEKLNNSKIETLFVADTIPLREDQRNCPKIKVLSQDYMFATAIDCIFNRKSISSAFLEARSSTFKE